ncbi:MAG: cache domain-containing protein [Bacteroidales bacterium]|nr:cache domain-containing protein [Bacteroidales bacterium]
MLKDIFTYKRVALGGLVLAMVLFVMSMTGGGGAEDTESIAGQAAEKVADRLELLDEHIEQALKTRGQDLMAPDRIPEDMVIYLYVNDSLQSWNNQFPVLNDRISTMVPFERLTPTNNRIISPLADIKAEPQYMNLGSKWYVVKAVDGDAGKKVIAGLEIKNSLIDDINRNDNGVNPKLKVPGRYSVHPLTESGGSSVDVDGEPLFKITYDSIRQQRFFDHSILRWFALMLFVAAMVIFLAGHRTMKAYMTVVPMLTILMVVSLFWGARMDGSHTIFAPSIFADGLFPSLGSLLIVNTYITLLFFCTYLIKGRITKSLCSDERRKKVRLATFGIIMLACIAAVFAYAHTTLVSLLNNSSISLELYRIGDAMLYSVLIYASYTGLFLSVLMQIQLMRPAIMEFIGKHVNVFSRNSMVAFAFLVALYFSITTSYHGFVKEQDRTQVWANRLAVDRDLSLELQLRSVEENISSDMLIAYMTALDNSSGMILNRITEYYLNRTRQAYNIGVLVFHEGDNAGESILYNIVNNGEPIADGSRFMFLSDAYGANSYAGIFMYYRPETGLNRMIVQIESNSNKEDRGYGRILGLFSHRGDVNIPSFYSYAKYKGGRLTSYKGNFPYPTIPDSFERGTDDTNVIRNDGYVHFVNQIGDYETIVITRPQRNILTYFTSFSYLFLVILLLGILLPKRKPGPKLFRSNYFRTRINVILFLSSFVILASMAAVSIAFVYKRNEKNMFNLMSSRVSTVQGLMADQTRYVHDWTEMSTQAFAASLNDISNATKADITLYTPGGKVFRSTSPEVFEKLILGSRIDQEAFYKIRNRNQRFYINRESVAGYHYWALYAPLFNERGDMIAIMSIPYTDRNYDFRSEAFFHAALIINLFILLLLVSLLISTRFVNSMFAPLVEMGKKMSNADIDSLEHIVYEREDEISSLVEAYNRMVGDLKDSTRRLAQAERDKAWSQMARQVAHEIKNPLTPIKLEIQRLIRLKQNNNPKWEQKFDQVADVILEHIQILSDTANDFSTFAKLYSEEPVLMDLDKTLKDQLMIFDNKENIRFSYIGMEEAYVMAPKPQLIRVFVNLITNGVQAVEIMQKEMAEAGQTPVEGHILICLRHSTRDGCYDIVFDDNGPGVKGENLDRLFTPNFTTKTGGTGLGLAISRNIVEKCGGEISYKKSFGLGGASFTVTIPAYRT